MKHLLASIVASIFVVVCGAVSAQSWPNKPVRLIVPGPAGSAPDTVARIIGDKLSSFWMQPVVVENKPGAGGNIGTLAGAKAESDGYTLTFGQSAPLALNQFTYKTLPFNPEKDFVPIVNLGTSPMMIALNNNVPARTLADLIALAKAKPGTVNYATSNSKNVAHLTGELVARMADVKLVHVPYQSNAQAGSETATGLNQVYIDGVPPMSVHSTTGRLRVIAVSSAKRLPNFPDIPAVSETLPGFEFNGWFCLVGPAGMPTEIVAKINRDVNAVLKMPEIATRLVSMGIYDGGGSSEDLARFIQSERVAFAKAVREAGIQPD